MSTASAIPRLVVAGLLLSCATQPRPPGPAGSGCPAPIGEAVDPAARPQPARLCGRLRLPAGATLPEGKANLVVVWFRPDEQARFRDGRLLPIDLIWPLFERARVIPGVSLGGNPGPEYALDYPGGPAVVFAVADFRHRFWETLLGDDAPGNFVGVSAPANNPGGRTDVALAPTPPAGQARERCQGDRFQLVRVDAPEVAGTTGNETARRLCVWLPASYSKSRRKRYPVVYLLPGFSGRDTSYLTGNRELRSAADALARDGVGEAILVGVDTTTRDGATYFTDSAAGGAWASFARQQMIQAIDRRYRTRPEARSRALVGHSTGGFNAVSLAFRYPEVFGAAAASAPDALDFEGWLLEADGRVRARWLAWTRLEAAVGGMGQMTSYAVAWSPDGTSGANAFPYDLQSGALRPEAWTSWKGQSPLRMLDDPRRVLAVRERLGGRLFITVGKNDEFGLHDPAQRFSTRLTELGVRHTFRSSEGGHGSDAHAGLTAGLTFAIRALSGH